MKLSYAPIVLSTTLIGVIGIIHARVTDRWGPSNQLQESVERLRYIPAVFGEWVSEDVPYESEEMTRSGVKGCIYRIYKNTRTKERVSALLVCGRGGPVCVHTPEVCYAGNGYTQVGQTANEIVDSDGSKNSFRVAKFGLPGIQAYRQMEVYYSWSLNGLTWQTPDSPRLSSLARSPALYKLYVVRELPQITRGNSSPVCRNFLTSALPVFGDALVGKAR